MHMKLPGIEESLPVALIGRLGTSAESAWLGMRHTVRLLEPVLALRVHSRGGTSAATQEHLAFGASTVGRWFAVGDVVLTRSGYLQQHALPAGFTHQDEWLLPATSILNVGIAGPLFGQPGGSLQAEWLSGPPPSRQRLAGYWLDRAGHA